MNLQIEIGNYSDVGKTREVNEDYYGSFTGNFGELLIVCDGMGGHKGGETASRLAVESVKNHFENLGFEFDPSAEIRKALAEANRLIINTAQQDPSLSDMGSTIVLVLFKNSTAHCAHLGDSRIYLIKDGKIRQLTKDHSLVQQMIDSNMITEVDAKVHPKKNVITKALGINAEIEPDILEPFELKENDKLILCTDGLTSYVTEQEIFELAENNTSQQASQKLVELANNRGGSDNITVQVASAVQKTTTDNNQVKIRRRFLSFVLLGLALAAIAFVIIKFDVISFGRDPQKVSNPENNTAPGKLKGEIKNNSADINNSTNQDSLNQNNEEELNHE